MILVGRLLDRGALQLDAAVLNWTRSDPVAGLEAQFLSRAMGIEGEAVAEVGLNGARRNLCPAQNV